MRKSTPLLIFLLVSAFISPIFSQSNNWCNISSQDAQQMKEYMFQVRNDMRGYVFDRSAVTYIPVRFFLVAKSDGTKRPSERLALQALCHLNEEYADQDIQFYLKEFKYMNNTAVNTNPESFSAVSAIKNAMIYNAINVFIVDIIEDPNVAAYYQQPAGNGGNDWIVVSDNYVDDLRVLAHEVGHFFSLLHTFNGWEGSGGWDPSVHGLQVGAYSPDGVLNEMVDGSNCQNAGDAICDTPADYMFPTNNCTYSGTAKDPKGQLVKPDLKNHMNYAFGCDDYYFSADQKEQIKQNLFHSTRNYIRTNYVPVTTLVDDEPTLISPANQVTLPSYNYVVLEWSTVPGATRYLVELINSTLGNQRYIVNTNKLILTTLPANKSFLWRVLAFNEYSTCANYSAQKIFKTGDVFSDSFEIPEVNDWSVQPNPVRLGQVLQVVVETSNIVEADVRVFNMTGQQILNFPGVRFSGSTSVREIPTGNLREGVYLINLATEKGSETKRVVIVE
jgi:hypothetical protein